MVRVTNILWKTRRLGRFHTQMTLAHHGAHPMCIPKAEAIDCLNSVTNTHTETEYNAMLGLKVLACMDVGRA